jgi:hypothetical protein
MVLRSRKFTKKHRINHRKRGGGNSKLAKDNLARSQRLYEKNYRKSKNFNSIFDHGHVPAEIERSKITNKLVNARTQKANFNNKRFLTNNDSLSIFLSPEFIIKQDERPILFGLTIKQREDLNLNFKPESFEQAVSSLYEYAVENKNNGFCNGQINPSYLSNMIVDQNYSNAVILLKRGEKIFGFAILGLDKLEQFVYIRLICGGKDLYGAGQKLMDYIVSFAKMIRSPKIKLGSIKVDATLQFYLKNGFHFDDSIDTDCKIREAGDVYGDFEYNGDCRMTKNI